MPPRVQEAAITLDQLRAFVAVVETGTFSAAARRIGRVQSAVSYAISTLEGHLGTPLFDRGGYRPALTGAGAALLGDARAILAQVQHLARRADELTLRVEPEIDLLVDVMFPLAALVAFARRFEERWPGVSLRLRAEALTEVVAQVEGGRATLGIAIGTLELGVLERRLLTHVRLVPVAAASHPLAVLGRPIGPADAAPYVQVVLSGRGREASAPDRGVLSGKTWRVQDLGAKHAFVRAGLGWGSLPADLVADDIRNGVLRPLVLAGMVGGAVEIPMVAVWRRDLEPGPAAAWSVQVLAGDA